MAKQTINFNLAKDLSEIERNATINAIQELAGDFNTAVIDTASELGKRLGFADVGADRNPEAVLKRIEQVPNVIYAEIAAKPS